MLSHKPELRPFFTIRNIIVSEFNIVANQPKNPKIADVMRRNYPLFSLMLGGIASTPAFTLRAKNILHVGFFGDLSWSLGFTELRDVYNNIMQHVAKLQPVTISFPAIAEHPDNMLKPTQAGIALDTIYQHLRGIPTLKRVFICVPDETSLKAYLEAAKHLASNRIVAI
jgi:O-acetyl-ADP-ribose deacetylase (regulator of RNase III)